MIKIPTKLSIRLDYSTRENLQKIFEQKTFWKLSRIVRQALRDWIAAQHAKAFEEAQRCADAKKRIDDLRKPRRKAKKAAIETSDN